MITNISYSTTEWLLDKHIVINEVGDSDIRAEYNFLYKINQQ